MTTEKSKAKEAMRHFGMRFADLASKSGLALSTVHAVLTGEKSSAKSRQAITDALGAEIWPGVFPSPQIRFEAGTTLVFSNAKQAREFAAEIGGGGERRDRYVRISTDLQLSVNPPAADTAQPAGRAGKPIDIWCGKAPPDSPFPPNEQFPARQRRGQGHTTKSKKASKPAAATGQTSA